MNRSKFSIARLNLYVVHKDSHHDECKLHVNIHESLEHTRMTLSPCDSMSHLFAVIHYEMVILLAWSWKYSIPQDCHSHFQPWPSLVVDSQNYKSKLAETIVLDRAKNVSQTIWTIAITATTMVGDIIGIYIYRGCAICRSGDELDSFAHGSHDSWYR